MSDYIRDKHCDCVCISEGTYIRLMNESKELEELKKEFEEIVDRLTARSIGN